MYIPDTVLRGHNIQFNCTFTLEDEKLFAIKWYRGNYEIFRYLPSSDVPMKTFPLEGYNVSVSIRSILSSFFLLTGFPYEKNDIFYGHPTNVYNINLSVYHRILNSIKAFSNENDMA